MSQSNTICFICLNGNISVKAILQNGSQNDTALQVRYVLPEVTIWDSVYICSLCCTSLHSFYTFKKRCLENYSHLMHKTDFVQGTSDAQTQKLTEIQIKTCNMKQEQDMDVELHEELIIKQESDYISPLIQEQGDQRTFADAKMGDLIVSKNNSEPECYPQSEFVKCEIESDCEQDCSSSVSEYKMTFVKEETYTDNENYTISENSDLLQEKELCKDPDYTMSDQSSLCEETSESDAAFTELPISRIISYVSIPGDGCLNNPNHSLDMRSIDNNLSSELKDNSTDTNSFSESVSCELHLKDNTANNGKCKNNGEAKKGNKGKDFCYFCESLVLNFSRHIQRNHAIEKEVQKIISLPTGSKERKNCLALLRKKGNFLNKNYTMKPMKQPTTCETLLPCIDCLGFYSAKQLWRHRKHCNKDNSKAHQSNAQNFLVKNLRIDSKLRKSVFPRMRPDRVSLIAKKDNLICAFGARYINQNREKYLVNVASRKMRELAKLLIEMNKREPSIKNLFEALKPKYFDLIINATKEVAKYDAEKDQYKSPTYALNLRTTLKQCCEIAIIFVLKRKEAYGTISAAEAEADLKTMIQLIDSQWRFEISTQVGNDLNMNKWNKVTLVPLASDLKMLKDYLIARASTAVLELTDDDRNKESYMVLLETIFCRVILLNRKRLEELEMLSLHTYEQSQDRIQNYEEFSSVLSPSEQVLMKKFKRIVIGGERGCGVLVLLSPDVQDHINVLFKYRQNFVNKNNNYLFGNPGTIKPISGYKTLEKYVAACGAKNPNAITATKVGKHLATLTQIFSMADSDIEQLATFMGHTVGVHGGSYKLPDDVYQTAKIAKLLLMEKGAAAEFKKKALNEIDVDLGDDLLNNENIDNDDNNDNEGNDPDIPAMSDDPNTNLINSPAKLPEKQKRILIPWTEEQKEATKLFFADHIKKKIPPKKHECLELMEQNSTLLKNKDWLKIKIVIQHIMTAARDVGSVVTAIKNLPIQVT